MKLREELAEKIGLSRGLVAADIILSKEVLDMLKGEYEVDGAVALEKADNIAEGWFLVNDSNNDTEGNTLSGLIAKALRSTSVIKVKER